MRENSDSLYLPHPSITQQPSLWLSWKTCHLLPSPMDGLTMSSSAFEVPKHAKVSPQTFTKLCVKMESRPS
ncbi:hypothetical protein RIF29_21321 [Crotalaria pallida]|uniref:Uncharacterized protein n=1 Tax=Crotalaria pallida TaxID=3830 RepID=A0AAN9F2S9_CROPI